MGLMGLNGTETACDNRYQKRSDWVTRWAVAGTVVVTGALKLSGGHINQPPLPWVCCFWFSLSPPGGARGQRFYPPCWVSSA